MKDYQMAPTSMSLSDLKMASAV